MNKGRARWCAALSDFDAANNLTKMTYPDNWAVDFVWDARNRIDAANDNNGSTPRLLADVAYDSRSRRQLVKFANGTSAHYGYTNRGDLTCLDLNFTGATPANCNATSGNLPELAYDFTYNGVGQTLGKTVNDHSYLWTPGANKIDTYQVNGLNQYTNVGGATLAHDGNGNLTTDHRGRTYAYDAENVLRSASGLASGNASYRYWADGSRREKSYNGATSQFYYMGGLGYLDEEDTQFASDQEIAEYSGATLTRRYLRLPGSVDETFLMIDYSSGSAVERWSHQNRLGSVIAVTDSAGAVVEKYRYSPYGESGSEGDGGFPFRFTGQKLDPETGLYYYKARYYDPEVGRFLQTDPIGYEDQMNLYAYVHNDPVNVRDPSGMDREEDFEIEVIDSVETTENSDGSQTDTRTSTLISGGAGSKEVGGQRESGSITRLPQESFGGAPATVTENMQGRLLNLSDQVGETVEVTSGTRTPAQNEAVGGAPGSSHLVNEAADIRIPGHTAAQTADAAHASGQFNRTNEYTDGRGVHVDTRSTGNQGRFTDWVHQPDPD